MGFIYASTTLMQKIMIQKSVSMPPVKKFKSHGDDAAQKMTWNWICSIWMINSMLHQRIILLIKQVIKSPLLMTLLKDGLKMLDLDDQHKATSKDHPAH